MAHPMHTLTSLNSAVASINDCSYLHFCSASQYCCSSQTVAQIQHSGLFPRGADHGPLSGGVAGPSRPWRPLELQRCEFQNGNTMVEKNMCKLCTAESQQRLLDTCGRTVNRSTITQKAPSKKNVQLSSCFPGTKSTESSFSAERSSSTSRLTCRSQLFEDGNDSIPRSRYLWKLHEDGFERLREIAHNRVEVSKIEDNSFQYIEVKRKTDSCGVERGDTTDVRNLQNPGAGISSQIGAQQAGDMVGDADRLVEAEEGLLNSSRAQQHFGNSYTKGRRELLLGTVLSGLAFGMLSQSREAGAASTTVATEKKKTWLLGDVAPAQVLETPEKAKGSRIYDASVLGEPVAVGKDKGRVWQKLLTARVVYLGEAERVPDSDDKVLELEIVRTLRDKCFEEQRPVSLAMEAFPCTLQPQLNQYMSKRLSDDDLRGLVTHWPDERWKEYQPLLQYCRNNGVRLMACGTPLEVLRTVQAKGVQGLSNTDKRKYVPPMGGGFGLNSASISQQLSLADVLPNASVPFGPGPYRFAQARMVEDHITSQVVIQAMADGGSVGLLIVIVGATHVLFGSKGSGIPARISKKLQKRTQAIVLLNPERQRIRKEGDIPEADFLWYSAAKPCSRNCFDRAEVARVMDAAGRRRDALPKDLQTGLDLGLVSPEVLKDFFDLEKQPFIAELTHRFQGFRERWLADPRFLQRLAIEETISITTTLLAQYERRKGRFFEELDYVITDSVRGAVVDFFTVWLPAPTLSFRSSDAQSAASGALFEGLTGLLGSFPDNAFQRASSGVNWDLKARVLAVVVGGLKLCFVGFVASIGTVTVTNAILGVKQRFNPQKVKKSQNKRSPIVKTALVYGSFLGTSANLRYQVIAGFVEHWIADYYLASQPLAGNALSFVARIANSYWGTQQWVDLARLTGLQAHNVEPPAIAVQSEFISETVSDKFESKSSSSEILTDLPGSKPDSWEDSVMECVVPSPVEDEHLEEKTVDSPGGHGK